MEQQVVTYHTTLTNTVDTYQAKHEELRGMPHTSYCLVRQTGQGANTKNT